MFVFSAGLAPDPENLPNLQQPRPQVFTAGQPTETGFREAKDMGVRTVINVLPEAECLPDEADVVRNARMNYLALPFDTTELNMNTVRRFSALMKTGPKPFLIHCSTGNHVGGLWFSYRVLMERATTTSALNEARMIGLQPELEAKVMNWVAAERHSPSAQK